LVPCSTAPPERACLPVGRRGQRDDDRRSGQPARIQQRPQSGVLPVRSLPAQALRALLVGQRWGARRALRRHVAAPGAARRPLDRPARASGPHPRPRPPL